MTFMLVPFLTASSLWKKVQGRFGLLRCIHKQTLNGLKCPNVLLVLGANDERALIQQ